MPKASHLDLCLMFVPGPSLSKYLISALFSNNWSRTEKKKLDVNKKVKHHSYSRGDHVSCKDNIGLINLKNEVKGIVPICLPSPTLPQEQKARIIGFDNLNEKDDDDRMIDGRKNSKAGLSKGITRLVGREACKKAYPARYDKQSWYYSSKNHAIFRENP